MTKSRKEAFVRLLEERDVYELAFSAFQYRTMQGQRKPSSTAGFQLQVILMQKHHP